MLYARCWSLCLHRAYHWRIHVEFAILSFLVQSSAPGRSLSFPPPSESACPPLPPSAPSASPWQLAPPRPPPSWRPERQFAGRSKISQLFIFGSGQDPLFLAGSADPNNPASLQAHGDHFMPSAIAENGA